METPIVIVASFVAVGAVVVIVLLAKMLVTGNYSMLFGKQPVSNSGHSGGTGKAATGVATERRQSQPNVARRPATNWKSQKLAVGHFAPELREWDSEDQRREAAQALKRMRESHNKKSRLD